MVNNHCHNYNENIQIYINDKNDKSYLKLT